MQGHTWREHNPLQGLLDLRSQCERCSAEGFLEGVDQGPTLRVDRAEVKMQVDGGEGWAHLLWAEDPGFQELRLSGHWGRAGGGQKLEPGQWAKEGVT